MNLVVISETRRSRRPQKNPLFSWLQESIVGGKEKFVPYRGGFGAMGR